MSGIFLQDELRKPINVTIMQLTKNCFNLALPTAQKLTYETTHAT